MYVPKEFRHKRIEDLNAGESAYMKVDDLLVFPDFRVVVNKLTEIRMGTAIIETRDIGITRTEDGLFEVDLMGFLLRPNFYDIKHFEDSGYLYEYVHSIVSTP